MSSHEPDSPVVRVFTALRWLAGQELKKAHRDQAEDYRAAAAVLWPNDGLSVDEIPSALRGDALAAIPTARLSAEHEAIIMVHLGRQQISKPNTLGRNKAEALGSPWTLTPARSDTKRSGERRRKMIDSFGLVGCTLDQFRDNYENPALQNVAEALVHQRRLRPHLDVNATLEGSTYRESVAAAPVDDAMTTEAINTIGRQALLDVLCALFPDRSNIVFKAIRPGMSGSAVFLVYPHKRAVEMPCVVKVGAAAEIEAERLKREHYADRFIRGKHLPAFRGAVVAGELGGIAYEFSGNTTFNNLIEQRSAAGDLLELQRLAREALNIRVFLDGSLEKVYRDILREDYPLNESDLRAFEALCGSIPEPLFSQLERPSAVREVWSGRHPAMTQKVTLTQRVALCHGDFYGDNILVDEDDDLFVIDVSKMDIQHYLRDFTTLEGDAVLRSFPARVIDDDELQQLVHQLTAATCPRGERRHLMEIAEPHLGGSIAGSIMMSCEIRRGAWLRMEGDEGDILSYQLGLIRRLVRSAIRAENRLTDSQRAAGAALALAHASSFLAAIGIDAADGQGPGGRAHPAKRAGPAQVLEAKIQATRRAPAQKYLLIGGVYLDLILAPIQMTQLRREEWSNIESIQMRIGGSCAQVGQVLYEYFNRQSLLFTTLGGAADPLSSHAKLLLSRESWIAEVHGHQIPGCSTAVSVHLQQGSGLYSTILTHKGALEQLTWDVLWSDLLAEYSNAGGVAYIAGYFRTKLSSSLDIYLKRLGKTHLIILDHGLLVPEVESGDAVQRLRQSFSRGHVDVYICTVSELAALAAHPTRIDLPPVGSRDVGLIEDYARRVHLPPVTIIRDQDWPGPSHAYLLLEGQHKPELISVGESSLISDGVGIDNAFNAGFLHAIAEGLPNEDLLTALRGAIAEGLSIWLKASEEEIL